MKQTDKKFLSMIFGVKAALGRSPYDKEVIARKLADVFGVSKEARKTLLDACEDVDVKSLHSLDDYLRYMRTLDYEERYGKPVAVPEEVGFAIECAGDEFKAIEPLTDECGLYPTATKLRAALGKPEINNLVAVAAIGAFLYFEGIGLPHNKAKGFELAEKCLRWNNVEGIVLLLTYGDEKKKREYLSALKTVVEREGCEDDYAEFIAGKEKKYGKAVCLHEATCIADYLDGHPSERAMFNAAVSRIARSPLVREADKKRLLSAEGKNSVAPYVDLAVDEAESSDWDKVWDYVSESRKKEAKQMDVGLRKQSSGEVLTPVLVGRDAISIGIHEKALRKAVAGRIPVVTIDASRATAATFAPVKSNEIVKTLINGNTPKAIFVITGVDGLSEEKAEQLSRLLDAESKANYTLTDLNVSVDLSGCAFVLTAAAKNVSECLRALSLFVNVEKANEEEKAEYVESVFETQKKAYECTSLILGETGKAFLADKSIEYVSAALEGVCHEHSYDEDRYEVTVRDLEEAVDGVYESQMTFVIKK